MLNQGDVAQAATVLMQILAAIGGVHHVVAVGAALTGRRNFFEYLRQGLRALTLGRGFLDRGASLAATRSAVLFACAGFLALLRSRSRRN